jgi:hypothetical protein
VKRMGSAIFAASVAVALTIGCTPNKEQGTEDYRPAKFDSFGINTGNDNVGRDKGPAAMMYLKRIHNREPHLVGLLERHAERIPGVADIKVLAFKDNLIVGVLPAGTPRPDVIDPTPSIPYTPGKPSRIDNGHTDHLQQRVVNAMRTRLQAETRFNVLFVSTNRAVYERIAGLHDRISRGVPVRDDEFQSLLNDIGYTTKGFDLVH